MAKKRTGLGIEALFPQEEEVVEEVVKEREPSRPQTRAATRRSPAKSKTAGKSEQTVSREERIKTSVEMLPETIELIGQIKSQHRREHRQHLPMWKILDEAVREFAERRLG